MKGFTVMRGCAVAVALSIVLLAAPVLAQTPAAPAAPAGASVPAPAPAPFPQGAKYAFINVQRIANESTEGKAATGRVQALNQKKVTELNEKNKALQTAQQKLDSSASVMNDAARGLLQKDIERQQVDIQRFTEDAQQEVQALQNDLMNEFQRKLAPVIQQVAQEKKLDLLFSASDSGIVWAEPGLDLTDEVIKKFDGSGGTAAAPVPAAPKPAAPAAAAPRPAAPAAPKPAAPAKPQ